MEMKTALYLLIPILAISRTNANEIEDRLPEGTAWKIGHFEADGRVFEYRERQIDVVLEYDQLTAREATDCTTLLEIAGAFLHIWEISHDVQRLSRLCLSDDRIQDRLEITAEIMAGNVLQEGRRYSRLVEYEGFYFLIGRQTPENNAAIKHAVGVYRWDYGRWWAVFSPPDFEKVGGPLFRREILKHPPTRDP